MFNVPSACQALDWMRHCKLGDFVCKSRYVVDSLGTGLAEDNPGFPESAPTEGTPVEQVDGNPGKGNLEHLAGGNPGLEQNLAEGNPDGLDQTEDTLERDIPVEDNPDSEVPGGIQGYNQVGEQDIPQLGGQAWALGSRKIEGQHCQIQCFGSTVVGIPVGP